MTETVEGKALGVEPNDLDARAAALEQVARIIGPNGWRVRDHQYARIAQLTMSEGDRAIALEGADYYTRDSLEKARAVLSAVALQTPATPGSEPISSTNPIPTGSGEPYCGFKIEPNSLLPHQIAALQSDLDATRARVRELEAGLVEAAEQFDFYARQHLAKGTDEAFAKAATNADWAERLRALSNPVTKGESDA